MNKIKNFFGKVFSFLGNGIGIVLIFTLAVLAYLISRVVDWIELLKIDIENYFIMRKRKKRKEVVYD